MWEKCWGFFFVIMWMLFCLSFAESLLSFLHSFYSEMNFLNAFLHFPCLPVMMVYYAKIALFPLSVLRIAMSNLHSITRSIQCSRSQNTQWWVFFSSKLVNLYILRYNKSSIVSMRYFSPLMLVLLKLSSCWMFIKVEVVESCITNRSRNPVHP